MVAPELVALVVASGAALGPAAAASLRADLVIAADGGLDAALAMGLSVDLVVGDMDSVSADALAAAEAAGVEIERHPVAKDESDLELAIGAAVIRGAGRVHVVVQAGGRLDHAAANLAVLASPRWLPTLVEATVGDSRVWVVRGRVSLPLVAGDHVALLAIGGDARGISTEGLLYPLSDETLDAFAARGTANEVSFDNPIVSVADGVLLAISSRS